MFLRHDLCGVVVHAVAAAAVVGLVWLHHLEHVVEHGSALAAV